MTCWPVAGYPCTGWTTCCGAICGCITWATACCGCCGAGTPKVNMSPGFLSAGTWTIIGPDGVWTCIWPGVENARRLGHTGSQHALAGRYPGHESIPNGTAWGPARRAGLPYADMQPTAGRDALGDLDLHLAHCPVAVALSASGCDPESLRVLVAAAQSVLSPQGKPRTKEPKSELASLAD